MADHQRISSTHRLYQCVGHWRRGSQSRWLWASMSADRSIRRQTGAACRREYPTIVFRQGSSSFSYKMLGQMATIGHHKGVCSILGFRFSGFVAWWLTRTVHLLKLPESTVSYGSWSIGPLNSFFRRPQLPAFKKNSKDCPHACGTRGYDFSPGGTRLRLLCGEEGELEAIRYHDDGQVLWRDELIPGDHFGEGSFLYGVVRQVTVSAKTTATLMVFN